MLFNRLRLRSLFAVSALLTLLACQRSPAPTDENPDTGIVRGKSVDAHEIAARSVVALVAVMEGGQALCSGTVLSDDTVLTAAHCVDHAPSKLVVVFGTRVSGALPEKMRTVDSFVQHPRWQAPSEIGRGDLALVHFQGGLVDGFEPVHLAPASTKVDRGTETLMLGYGVTDGLNHAGAGVLRETMTVVTGRHSETEVVTDGHKSSVCFGDSGGPAFIIKKGQPLQWGVASSVANQACNQSSVHTDLASYLTWLRTAAQRLRRNQTGPSHQDRKPTALPVIESEDHPDSSEEMRF